MNTRTLEKILKLSKIASSDKSRKNIGKVLVRAGLNEGSVELIATDGARVAFVETHDAELYQFLQRARTESGGESKNGLGIVMEDLAALKRAKLKEVGSVKYGDFTGSSWPLLLNRQIQISLTLGDFPEVDLILTGARLNEGQSVTLNAEFLAELLEALREQKNHTGITITLGADKHKAILVDCAGNSAVLMPRFLSAILSL